MNIESAPRPKDVIFVLSSAKVGIASGFMQRMLFDSPRGPLFSHVAMVIDQRHVIEANSTPGRREKTWSGTSLGEGVRLRTLPDLLYDSCKWTVLRDTKAAHLHSDNLSLSNPQIATLLGSDYSGIEVWTSVKRLAKLVSMLPPRLFSLKAPADDLAQQLRDDPAAFADIEHRLRTSDFISAKDDYFCSQLVALLIRLADPVYYLPKAITPCGLFDALIKDDWEDVTETTYSRTRVADWLRSTASLWEMEHMVAMSKAAKFKDKEYAPASVRANGRSTDFSVQLENLSQKLNHQAKEKALTKFVGNLAAAVTA
jgi:hypothetical protein